MSEDDTQDANTDDGVGGGKAPASGTQVIVEDVRGGWSMEDTLSPDRLPIELKSGAARYQVVREIGRGSMGVIEAVRDLTLERIVAKKTLLPKSGVPNAAARFLDEARITAQLQHAGIVAVFEINLGADNLPFFTMRLVEGHTLRDILHGLKKGKPDVIRQFTRVRLLNIFNQVCAAVAYAHNRGVIHRDLKPDNIMLGGFGEVYVMDWGLAKIIRTDVDVPITGGRPDLEAFRTRVGDITGTPQYMSPEQAMGLVDALNERSDIFSLGAILYEILTLRPPHEGTDVKDLLAKVRRQTVQTPSQVAPALEIPPELEGVVMQCLSRKQEDRFASALELRDQIERCLADRSRTSMHRVSGIASSLRDALRSSQSFKDLARRRRRVAREVANARSLRLPDDSAANRQRHWDSEVHLSSLAEDVNDAFSLSIALYQRVLNESPDNHDARDGLRDLYWYRCLEAERLLDRQGRAVFEGLARQFDDDGVLRAALRGDGALLCKSDPSARLTLYRYEEHQQRFEPMDPRACGETPLTLDPLPMGSYLLLLESDRFEPTRIPVLVRRQASLELKVTLLPRGGLPRGFVHVPGGPFQAGATNPELRSAARSLRQTEDFLISREPVTTEQYAAFLNALQETDPKLALRHVPRSASASIRLGTHGHYAPAESGDLPVTGIDFASAEHYCAWFADIQGEPCRLPTEDEWEKSGRGTDGRAYPWGDCWEASFCVNVDAGHGGHCQPVGNPLDESPYGVRDLAGGVREWTQTVHPRHAKRRAVRGGSFRTGRADCHLAHRSFVMMDEIADDLGFRVVLELALAR